MPVRRSLREVGDEMARATSRADLTALCRDWAGPGADLAARRAPAPLLSDADLRDLAGRPGAAAALAARPDLSDAQATRLAIEWLTGPDSRVAHLREPLARYVVLMDATRGGLPAAAAAAILAAPTWHNMLTALDCLYTTWSLDFWRAIGDCLSWRSAMPRLLVHPQVTDGLLHVLLSDPTVSARGDLATELMQAFPAILADASWRQLLADTPLPVDALCTMLRAPMSREEVVALLRASGAALSASTLCHVLDGVGLRRWLIAEPSLLGPLLASPHRAVREAALLSSRSCLPPLVSTAVSIPVIRPARAR
jgi:hypothetical protein